MSFALFDAAIPVFQQTLKSLSGILAKADAHVHEHKQDEAALLNARLAPDMFEFKRQIQIACDHAKGASARLAGVDVPRFADNETSIAELQLRIQNTLDFMATLSPAQFADAAERDIELVFPWATYNFKGGRYLTYWALPNFFFHATTAYNILRQQGVVLGKADFLGH